MAQTKQQIMELLGSIDASPRHRFGQNFMIDQNLVRLVVESGQICSGDVILEVGPGTGTLTEELLASAAEKVVVVEIDRDLAALLQNRFADEPRFELIQDDALAGKHALCPEIFQRFSTARGKLIANLPYNIASPLVIELLLAGVNLLCFTVQKEVAERLRAKAGSDAYGPLSAMAQLLGKVEVLRTLGPGAFWPAPKIDSSLVRIVRDDQLGEYARDFSRFVHQLFSARRKTMRKVLSMLELPAEQILADLQIDPMLRPEDLTPAQLLAVFFRSQAPAKSASETTTRPPAAPPPG